MLLRITGCALVTYRTTCLLLLLLKRYHLHKIRQGTQVSLNFSKIFLFFMKQALISHQRALQDLLVHLGTDTSRLHCWHFLSAADFSRGLCSVFFGYVKSIILKSKRTARDMWHRRSWYCEKNSIRKKLGPHVPIFLEALCLLLQNLASYLFLWTFSSGLW